MSRPRAVAFLAVACLGAGPALADDDHEDHHPWHASARAMYSLEHHHAELAHLGGLGAGLSRILVPEWLEVELGVAVMFGGDGVRHVPIELVLLKPFELGGVEVAVGAGPLVELGFHHAEDHVAFGGSIDAELLVWATDRLGLKINTMLELKSEEGEFVQELGAGVGPVFGW